MILEHPKVKELISDKIFTIPNIITFSRLFLLPFFFYYSSLYSQNRTESKYLFYLLFITSIAIFTDYIDGKIARVFKMESILGRYLDPVCDKFVTIGGLYIITIHFQFPVWALGIYIIREMLGLWLGSYLFIKRGFQARPNWWGKIGVGVVGFAVIWHISMPIIEERISEEHFLKHPIYSVYFLLFVLFGGIIAYSKKYWNDVFGKHARKGT